MCKLYVHAHVHDINSFVFSHPQIIQTVIKTKIPCKYNLCSMQNIQTKVPQHKSFNIFMVYDLQ